MGDRSGAQDGGAAGSAALLALLGGSAPQQPRPAKGTTGDVEAVCLRHGWTRDGSVDLLQWLDERLAEPGKTLPALVTSRTDFVDECSSMLIRQGFTFDQESARGMACVAFTVLDAMATRQAALPGPGAGGPDR